MTDRKGFYESRAPRRVRETDRHYQQLLRRHFRQWIAPGQRVLELGCSLGDLLAAVQPGRGVGVDFSPAMIELARERHPHLEFHVAEAASFEAAEPFDVIILSDLVNDVPDVQALLENALRLSHPRTRLVLNFFNNLWRPVLAVAESMDWKSPTLPQNWLSDEDMLNLLKLAGWEKVKLDRRILFPVPCPGLEPLLNRVTAPFLSHLCLALFLVARPRPVPPSADRHYSVSVVIPARNEAGNIAEAVRRLPAMGKGVEILFVEGGSKDNTWDAIQQEVARSSTKRPIRAMRQPGEGKGDAVREGFAAATGEILMILDADLSVEPEVLPKFYEALRSGRAEFVNGVRLVYPLDDQAMRFLNMVANKGFGLIFSWLLGQPIKDTLCGTKALFRNDYEAIAANRAWFGDFDPFGDFDLLFGAAKLNLDIVDLPVRYRARTYGETNIQRWRHGWLLFRMAWIAARRLKFVG